MLYTGNDIADLGSSVEKTFHTNGSDAAASAGVDFNQILSLAIWFNGTDAVRVALKDIPDTDVRVPGFDPSWSATAWRERDGAIHVRGSIPPWLVVQGWVD
jgi:hypothetical protein